MRLASLVLCSILVSPAAGQSFLGTIAFSQDGQSITCMGSIAPGSPATLHVLYQPMSFPPNWITLGGFRVDGIPPAWTPLFHPAPAASFSMGDPFAGGCAVAFYECQQLPPLESGGILLGTITMFPTTQIHEGVFCVGAATSIFPGRARASFGAIPEILRRTSA